MSVDRWGGISCYNLSFSFTPGKRKGSWGGLSFGLLGRRSAAISIGVFSIRCRTFGASGRHVDLPRTAGRRVDKLVLHYGFTLSARVRPAQVGPTSFTHEPPREALARHRASENIGRRLLPPRWPASCVSSASTRCVYIRVYIYIYMYTYTYIHAYICLATFDIIRPRAEQRTASSPCGPP